MRLLKVLAGSVTSLGIFIRGQFRILRRRQKTPFYIRLISAISLLSVVMVVIFALKVIGTHSGVKVVIGTAGQGGEYCTFGENLKQVINDNQSRIIVETRSTLGSCENMQLLESEEIQLAIVQHDTPAKPSIRAIASLFPEVLHLIVDNSIDSIADLKGKRIAVIPNLLGENNDPNDPTIFFYQLIRRYGLEGDIEVKKTNSISQAAKAYLDGKVDAVILFIAVGNDCVGGLLAQQNRPARLLPIEVNAVEIWYPYVEGAQIHKASFWGEPAIPAATIPSVSVQSLLMTHKKVDTKIIMEITRILHEHRNKLIVNNPRAATIRLPDSGENLGVPLHVGAKEFYHRERPGFMVTYADLFALILSVAVLGASGMWHIRLKLQQVQKNRADKYNLEILDLIEQARKIENLDDLRQVRQKMFDIFRRVLEDLDENRISAESFQLFTFPCEVALTAMRHQELILLNTSCPQVGNQNRDLSTDGNSNS